MNFSVIVGNAFVVDKGIWQLWLTGLSVDQATSLAQKRNPDVAGSYGLRPYITSQYRNFELLEQYLHRPKTLHSQLLFPLTAATKAYLIEKYYSFDERVVREILGKKLSSRTRKELEVVAERTKVPVAGCKRMFDNLKRVNKTVEDADQRIVEDIQREFLLSKDLAKHYAQVIFISNYRLDTFKRRLAHIRFSDFEYVASVLIQYFASPTFATPILDELDTSLAQDARDLRSILFNQRGVLDEYRSLVSTHLAQAGGGLILERGGAAFKLLLRNILVLCTSTCHSKDLRDFFINLQSTVTEVVQSQLLWSPSHLELFFDACACQFACLTTINSQLRDRYKGSVVRMMEGMKRAALRFYIANGRNGTVIHRSSSVSLI
ncbi:acidic fibroblast growth factor binding protein [Phlyctochytrium arcticum]|nr:acidic fibroblast growth factor binding protein [Phlyctochytrium arcticum]